MKNIGGLGSPLGLDGLPASSITGLRLEMLQAGLGSIGSHTYFCLIFELKNCLSFLTTIETELTHWLGVCPGIKSNCFNRALALCSKSSCCKRNCLSPYRWWRCQMCHGRTLVGWTMSKGNSRRYVLIRTYLIHYFSHFISLAVLHASILHDCWLDLVIFFI